MFVLIINISMQSRLKNWDLLLETTNSIMAPTTALHRVASSSLTPKIKSQIHHMRGLAHISTPNRVLARQEFEKSLKVDVLCFDSLEQIIINNMLTVAEGIYLFIDCPEQDLVNSLDFSQAGDMADLLKTVYQSKLQKYQQPDTIDPIIRKLERDYHLENSLTVQIERADLLFSISKYKECIELTNTLYAMIIS
jgi:anaphase-promoting complex subunit 6